MPKFEITAPNGSVLEIEGDTSPTEKELDQIFSEGGFGEVKAPVAEERSTLSRTLAPTAGEGIDIPDKPFLEATAQTAITGLEIIDTPKRLLGTLRGFSATDPESALLAPEAKKVKEAAAKLPLSLPGKFGAKVAEELLLEAPTLGFGAVTKGAKKIGEKVFKGADVGLNRLAENISKLSEEAFSFIKTKGKEGVRQLEQAQGKASEIGQELKTLIFDKPDKFFKEKEIIDKALTKMGDVPLEKTLKEIDKQINLIPLKESQSGVVSKLEKIRKDIGEARTLPGSKRALPGKEVSELKDIMGQTVQKKSFIPGTTIQTEGREILSKTSEAALFKRKQRALDDIIDWKATGAKVTDKALKQIRKTMSDELFEVAKKTKNQEFILATNSARKKLKAIEDFKVRHGTNFESFVENLFGKGKSETIKNLGEIEKVFGIKIKDRAKLAKLSSELEPRDFAVALAAPRRVGEAFNVSSLLGSVISPSAAIKAVNILEGLGKGAGGAADLAEAGIDAAQLGAITNFMKRLAESPEPEL